MDTDQRRLNSSEILQLFMETASRSDRCYDFPIKHYLTIYEKMNLNPNFAQAAMLIINAAHIYGYKVDYLENLILNFVGSKRGDEEIVEGETTNIIKRRKTRHSKKSPLINESCFQYKRKHITTKPIQTFLEKINSNSAEMSENQTSSSAILKKVNEKYPATFFRRLNAIQTNSTCPAVFGCDRVHDKDFNDIDSRRNYRVYTDMIIQHSNTICSIADYERNITSSTCSSDGDSLTFGQSMEPQHLCLPFENQENLNDNENCDLDHIQPCHQERLLNLLRLDTDILCKLNRKDVQENLSHPVQSTEDSAIEVSNLTIDTSKNIHDKDIDEGLSVTCDDDVRMDVGVDDIENHIINNNSIGVTSGPNWRKSCDEGYGVSSHTSPSHLSELEPVVELFDIFDPVNNEINPDLFRFNMNTPKPDRINPLRIPLTEIDEILDYTIFRNPKDVKRRRLIDVSRLEKKKEALCNNVDIDFEGFNKKDVNTTSRSLDKLKRISSQLQASVSQSIIEQTQFLKNLTSEVHSNQSTINSTLNESNSETVATNADTTNDITMNGSNVFESTRLTESNSDANETSLQNQTADKRVDNQSEHDTGFVDGNDTATFFDSGIGDEMCATQPSPANSPPLPANPSPLPALPTDVTVTNEPYRNSYDLTASSSKTTEHLAMTERVKNWHNSLLPVLANSSKTFSINEIKSNITNFCSNNSNSVTFENLIDHYGRNFTARYLLGLLELVNLSDVQIEHSPSAIVCQYDELKIHHKNSSANRST